MKMSTVVWIVVVLGLVFLSVWYFMPRPASANPVLTVTNDPALGDFLIASNGMTLYRYANDTKDVTNCYDICAMNWPPYLRTTAAPLVGGAGVTGAITTVTRTDGTEQITYNGVPLYFWTQDVKPGDTTGQNFNGIWFVVHP